MCTVVVLPAPFGPSRAKTVPAATLRSIPSSATVSPNDLWSAGDLEGGRWRGRGHDPSLPAGLADERWTTMSP